MAKFKVEVTQWFRVSRTITLEVEAASIEEAVAKQQDEGDVPSYEDPRWEEDRDLTNEQVYPA